MRTFTVVTLDGHRLVHARSRDHLARLLCLFLPLPVADSPAVAAAVWRGRAFLDRSTQSAVLLGAFRP